MKIIIGVIVLAASIVFGAHQPKICMDPNTNTPIDCSIVSQ